VKGEKAKKKEKAVMLLGKTNRSGLFYILLTMHHVMILVK